MNGEIKISLLCPQPIPDDHWINEPRFEWFKKGMVYASTQTQAISALSKCEPGELYHVVTAIMRGAGVKEPFQEQNLRKELSELRKRIIGSGQSSHLDLIATDSCKATTETLKP